MYSCCSCQKKIDRGSGQPDASFRREIVVGLARRVATRPTGEQRKGFKHRLRSESLDGDPQAYPAIAGAAGQESSMRLLTGSGALACASWSRPLQRSLDAITRTKIGRFVAEGRSHHRLVHQSERDQTGPR
jgi:hypothetical protein